MSVESGPYTEDDYINATVKEMDLINKAFAATIEELQRENDQLQTKLAESEARVGRLESGLKEIKKHYGKVCSEFGLCEHESCNSSCAAWMIADGLLNETKLQSLQHLQAEAALEMANYLYKNGYTLNTAVEAAEEHLAELRQQPRG